MINRIGIAALWLLGALAVFVGINNNDPYLIKMRGPGNVAMTIAGIVIVIALIRSGYWRRSIAGSC